MASVRWSESGQSPDAAFDRAPDAALQEPPAFDDPGTALDLFAGWAALDPSAPAVTAGASTWTRDALLRAALALREAIEAAAGPLGRTAALIGVGAAHPAVLMACLADARHCAVLDPSHPPSRIAAALGDFRPACVVADGRSDADAVAPGVPFVDAGPIMAAALASRPGDPRPGPRRAGRPREPDEGTLALSTSGSSGRPKTVVNSRRALTWRARLHAYALGLGPGDVVACVASPSTIAATRETLAALVSGAVAAQADPAALGIAGVRLALGEARTTVLSGVPGLVLALLEGRADAWGATRLRAVRLHGERPSWADVDAVRAGAPGAAVQIGYSSTEVPGAQWFVPPGARRTASHPPAGRMLPGVRWRLVDPRGRDASAGELVVAGPAAAIGEWREGRLVPAPEQRTGDLVGVDADGLVEVLGRLDRQIRIAGRRVEPAEIEAALRRAASVADAVVLPDASRGATEVVAYVAADPSREAAVRASLREALDSGLPRSWHPQRIHVAAVLPRLPGGKLDVPALRALDEASTRASGAAATPRDAASAAVDRAWRAVLRWPPPSDGSSWTGSGGDSLSMLRFVFEAERALGARIPVAALSMDMGPGEIAAALRRLGREPRRDGPPGRPPVALFPGITGDSPSLAAFRAEVSEGLWLVPVEYPSWRTMAAAGGGSVAMMADAAAAALAAVPGGPVGLMGYSIGGAVAAELSLRLSREGHALAWSIVLDSDVGPGPGRRRRSTARILATRDRDPLVVLAVRTAARWLSHPSACRTFAALARPGAVAALPGALPFVVDREMTEALQKRAFRRWVAEGPRPLPTGPIWVMRSAESRDRQAGDLGWSRHGEVAAVVDVEGCHLTMLTRPARATLVRLVLDAAAILESSRTRCASQSGTGC